ncbi:hypothetical protein MSAN_00900900 [Mycena sanguinolenta]|uniref:Uncharacterized protein n=1 Tax=Mycena sanguinolenta TaxID=230812 RepID=A0A8H6YZ40_9AGAR|nr:hypothetical protein MSAN_00900900 [Mycena sanguinolenta]
MAEKSPADPRTFNYKPRNHNYAPVYVAGFGISPAPPPLPPLSTKILARTVGNESGPHNQLHQLQSPLFGTLYAELRNLIFIYALTEYDDHSRPYRKHSYYYRPGFECAKSISTNLLLTCRRIYLETHLLPVSLNEHVFYMHRPPPYGKHASDYDAYFARMSRLQRGAVQSVHLFTQMHWLHARRAPKAPARWLDGLLVPKLIITIRHSDWAWWERRQALHINEPDTKWGEWIGSVPGLQELQLELETIETKKDELEERAKAARRWTFPLENGSCLVHDGAPAAQSIWLGSAALAPPGVRRVLNHRDFDRALEDQHDASYAFDLKLHVRRITFIAKPVV